MTAAATDDPTVTRFAPPNPQANALKTGTTADLPRVPEDFLAINTRVLAWYNGLKPQNELHCWMIDQIAITSTRIDHNARVDRRQRDRDALCASLTWDRDRASEAETLGGRLAHDPPGVVDRLKRTPQGCDWLIGRWARLARSADAKGGTWDEAQVALAFDLLGTRPDERDAPLGERIDDEGRVVEPPPSHAALARREIAELKAIKAQVAGLDALDRAMAEADYVAEPPEALRQLRRHDAELHRRLAWFVKQLNSKSPHDRTDPRVYRYFQPNPEPAPEPIPSPEPAADPAAVAVAEREDEAPSEDEVEVEVESAPAILSSRHEAKARRAEKRRDSRHRKLERRRA